MTSIVILLIGICFGIILGVAFMIWLMGKKLRDEFFGVNQENKPVVIDWADGHNKDFNVMMRGVLVFTGVIRTISLDHTMSGQRVHMEIVDKASEVMREFRY